MRNWPAWATFLTFDGLVIGTSDTPKCQIADVLVPCWIIFLLVTQSDSAAKYSTFAISQPLLGHWTWLGEATLVPSQWKTVMMLERTDITRNIFVVCHSSFRRPRLLASLSMQTHYSDSSKLFSLRHNVAKRMLSLDRMRSRKRAPCVGGSSISFPYARFCHQPSLGGSIQRFKCNHATNVAIFVHMYLYS